jgi:defect-in-organelle-trafficking protein DotC
VTRGSILAGCAAALLLAGCATGGRPGIPPAPMPGALRADVNPGGRAGFVMSLEQPPSPSLDELVNALPAGKAEENPEDRLRMPALRDTALSYGARGGLAWEARRINESLQRRSRELDRTWDFTSVAIRAPNDVMVLPPVISQATDTWESSEAGKTLRIADESYEIVQQARFAPVAPLWHEYLLRAYTPPEAPPDSLLPRNAGERDAWRRWVTEGWMQGLRQAHDIFEDDLRRLERDFTGMIRYKALLEKGMVSPPVVAEGRMGTTGSGRDMRVNDRAMRITADPQLVTDPARWSAPVSSQIPAEAATPPLAAPAVPTEPREGTRRRL